MEVTKSNKLNGDHARTKHGLIFENINKKKQNGLNGNI